MYMEIFPILRVFTDNAGALAEFPGTLARSRNRGRFRDHHAHSTLLREFPVRNSTCVACAAVRKSA
jgi:hypothetical protein